MACGKTGHALPECGDCATPAQQRANKCVRAAVLTLLERLN
jgi:hypothetical protein